MEIYSSFSPLTFNTVAFRKFSCGRVFHESGQPKPKTAFETVLYVSRKGTFPRRPLLGNQVNRGNGSPLGSKLFG
jgi:hypothetical protein